MDRREVITGESSDFLLPRIILPTKSRVYLAGSVLVAATLATYLNSLGGPFVFDDRSAITDNPSIRQLWPPHEVLTPPADCTVAGRPLVNLTLALNHAFGDGSPAGFHLANVCVHALSVALLFGVVRRTWRIHATREGRAETSAGKTASCWVAFGSAGLWGLHPLLTGSVTYISQRTELMMGLGYLSVLYAFIRWTETGARRWWAWAVVGMLGGLASKETMVTAPLLVALYDRAFVSESFAVGWRRHRWFFLSLAATWLILPLLMAGLSQRDVGFELGVPWWKYTRMQGEAILTYLRLVAWPSPLIFDYGPVYSTTLVPAILVAGLLGAAGWAYVRRPSRGFLAVAWFVLLAPTSSVIPIAGQPIGENRAYLPAIAATIGGVVFVYRACGGRIAWAMPVAAAALALVTFQRNRVYQRPVGLWSDTVVKRPMNPRAHEALGEALAAEGNVAEARARYLRALELAPDFTEAHVNLGILLFRSGEIQHARDRLQQAVRLSPRSATAHNNLSHVLLETGDVAGARRHAEAAVQFRPRFPDAQNNLANALLRQGDFAAARRHYEEAVRLHPGFAEAHMNLGVALRLLGESEAAVGQFRTALSLRAAYPEAHVNLGAVYLQLRRLDEARTHFGEALRLRPAFPEALHGLGGVYRQQGQLELARRHFEEALRLRPDYAAAASGLKQVLEEQKKTGPERGR